MKTRRNAAQRFAAQRPATQRNTKEKNDMREVIVLLESLTSYSASRNPGIEMGKGERPEAFDRRIWRDKAHYDTHENVFIPGVGFKLAIDEAAAILSERIRGKGTKTYTGVFQSGIAAVSDLMVGVKKSDLVSVEVYCHVDGNRKSGKRVLRLFPLIPKWKGKVTFRIFNDDIQEEDFERYLAEAGRLAGVGRGRPSKGCPAGNGRFRPIAFEWSEI